MQRRWRSRQREAKLLGERSGSVNQIAANRMEDIGAVTDHRSASTKLYKVKFSASPDEHFKILVRARRFRVGYFFEA